MFSVEDPRYTETYLSTGLVIAVVLAVVSVTMMETFMETNKILKVLDAHLLSKYYDFETLKGVKLSVIIQTNNPSTIELALYSLTQSWRI